MGWLFKSGCSRKELISERAGKLGKPRSDNMLVKSVCLAHCLPRRRILGRSLGSLGTDFHEGRPAGQRTRTLDHLRSSQISTGLRVGI